MALETLYPSAYSSAGAFVGITRHSDDIEFRFTSLFMGERLNEESYREKSFIFWPPGASLPFPKEDLAAVGFYYTGEDETIACYYCGIKISSWKHGTDPFEIHRQSSPNCRHLQALEKEKPKPKTLLSNFKEKEKRLRTFTSTCPETVQGLKTQLADAGFYYTGRSDVVRCAFCGGELHVAKMSKQPVTSHYEFFPACSFAKMQRHNIKKQSKDNQNEIHLTSSSSALSTKSIPTRITSLKAENEKLKTSVTCMKCRTSPVQILMLPCCHLVCCEECAEAVDDCPHCNVQILGTVKTFMA